MLILRRYLDGMERADLVAVAELLAEEVRTTMPPWPMWFRGRDIEGDHVVEADAFHHVGLFPAFGLPD